MILSPAKKPFHRIRLLSEVRSDIRLWLLFLEEFNEQCYFPDRLWIYNDIFQLYTDASGNSDLGFAAFHDGRWEECLALFMARESIHETHVSS